MLGPADESAVSLAVDFADMFPLRIGSAEIRLAEANRMSWKTA